MAQSQTFGEWIKTERKKRGWSQAYLSQLTTIPQTTLSWWETNKITNFGADERLVLLARAFSLRICELPFELLDNNVEMKPNKFKPNEYLVS
ncbi:helix-turn-helix domain-containing protein [Pallidibacillus pasinlerensis]|uniref:Helix-turn-helix transcriptional regulator n=1 Tax=Pallidibacillus pasinlerensis TaxID=2703818 RepID=A0ABX0A934_9BACI|nr:helix-turn-helix transcriptional regulator [Pallidibacillus pasinlerensis]NCU19071.1 helix-turn-helix transcriptional regulator [Pallidibacillus pasinlerensis]